MSVIQISDVERRHQECSFCRDESGLREWHARDSYRVGVIPDRLGETMEVQWCEKAWAAYYRIQNLLIHERNRRAS